MRIIPADYQITLGDHLDKGVIWLQFPYNAEKLAAIKVAGAKWSQSQKCWYLPDNAGNREACSLPPAGIGKKAMARITAVNQPALQRFRETLLLKGYSPSTLRTYCTEFAQLLYILKDVTVDSLGAERLRSYFLYCLRELKLSENALHSRINAIKFYFEQVLGREKLFVEIPRPKKPSILPKPLSAAEIKRLFAVTTNIKHRLMLQLCYGAGLRVSEVAGLRLAHIDSGRMQICIEAAKGKKDRYVHLPQTILDDLRKYYQQYLPKDYLFEGERGGQYSIRSIQAVFKAAMGKAKIRKQVGIHGLRHSYATHLHELGTDIAIIQKLLGHNDLKTTMIYTHVRKRSTAGVESPLDRL